MTTLAATSVAIVLALTAQDKPAAMPLIITNAWIETSKDLPPGQGVPRVEVFNTGQRTVLAWGVNFVLKRPDGQREGASGLGTDAGSVPAEQRTMSVAPGRAVASGRGGRVPADALFSDMVVSFVIFDDNSALGDEKEIAWQFAQRRDRQMFWQTMQAMLDRATTHDADPTAVLAQLRQGMEAESDPKFRQQPYYNEFLARMSARRIELTQTTPASVLKDIQTTVSAQKANADAHANRR